VLRRAKSERPTPAQRFAAALGSAWRGWALAGLYLLATGCGAEPVEARAIWVDEGRGEGRRRIHVYDRGALESFEVLGANEPIERVLLDPRGRGLIVRTGDRRGAWFDLDDGRRLPLLLPRAELDPRLGFADGALIWIDYDQGGALTVVPLEPEVALSLRADGSVEPLTRATSLRWTVTASAAPIVFAAERLGGRASFFRYPIRAEQPRVIALEAEAADLSLPAEAEHVALDPLGELAIFSTSSAAELTPSWGLFERRSPESAGPLELPPSLAELQAGNSLRLLQVLDRRISIWLGDGQLHRYDRTSETVDSLPTFASSSAQWRAVEQGRAGLLVMPWGPVYRADLDGLRPLSLDTTACQIAIDPIVSPSGRWAAWTCVELSFDLATTGTGTVVRVSEAGLERYVGVSMTLLAIDDDGDLLLYSSSESGDGLDPSQSGVPRTLFVLSGDGVLTRVDRLEPAPAKVLLATSEPKTYIQAVALAR
jgi:hypothetical protein